MRQIVLNHIGVWLFEELFHRSRNVSHIDPKCCAGFHTPFSWRFRKEWNAKVNFRFDFSPYLLPFQFVEACFFWKQKTHFQAGEADNWLTISWHNIVWPREAEKSTGGGHPELLPSSPREPNGIAYDTFFSPFFASGFFHIDCCCLFVYFITGFCSKTIWFSTCRKVYVWHGMVFLRTLTLTRSSFLDTLGKLLTALNTWQFSNRHPSLV